MSVWETQRERESVCVKEKEIGEDLNNCYI